MTCKVPELTAEEYQKIHCEIADQPSWRREADKCDDYYDNKQLDAEILHVMDELGLAPNIENLIAPTVDSVLGQETRNRADWIVNEQSDDNERDLSEALNKKINEAERESRADRACSDAYAGQVKAGLSWVFVGTESDPFRYPHLVENIHRNEIFFDWKSKPDLSDARWLVRKKWYDTDVLSLAFPDHAEIINGVGMGWGYDEISRMAEGGTSTGLMTAFATESGMTLSEQEWREVNRKRLCLSEVWYRRWIRGKVLKTPDNRVVEFDESNQMHLLAVRSGMIQPIDAVYSKVRLSWWIGPHKLADIECPYKHNRIPYVPFWGKRESMTGIPYGMIRTMIPIQDDINARNTKMMWLLAAKYVTMTEGVADPEEVREQARRADAVHVLDHQKMREGGVFKIESDLQLNQQQYQTLIDKRESIKRVAGVYAAFEGNNSNVTSGVGLQQLVDQSTQTLSEIYDNFRFARAQVGDLLLSNLIEEIGDKEEQVTLKASFGENSKVVTLNQRCPDGSLSNDIQRAKLKVALSEVPSTSSYRKQQLMMWVEMTKSAPPELQARLLKTTYALSDMPEKERAIEELQKFLGDGEDPEKEQMMQMIEQLKQALDQAQNDPKLREIDAKIELLLSQADEKKANTAKSMLELQMAEQVMQPYQQY